MSSTGHFRRLVVAPTRRARTRRRPHVELLEGRQLLSSFQVTSLASSGAGTLAQAITSSNDATVAPGGTPNTITFKIGTGGTETIALTSALPTITQPVVIDGTTQSGSGTAPRIILSGTKAGSKAVGLDLTASDCTIKGMEIEDFTAGGILVSGSSGDSITDDVVSANGAVGIHLTSGSSGDTIAGDFIGTSAAGTGADGNAGNGVQIDDGSTDNTIGGSTAAARDVISANTGLGVEIEGAKTTGNLVAGDYIGTNAAGTAGLGNTAGGVLIESASSTVGGLTTTPGTAPGNLISGNKAYGVEIDGSSATGALVEGNLIGTDVTGTKALGNTDSGVDLDDASGATVGGTTAAARNVISANSGNGVHILDTSTDNVVEGNFIGTNAAGTKALGNADDGVLIDTNSTGNTVGGSTAGATNVISANTKSGVVIDGTGTTGNLVAGDFIGTNAAGTAGLGNAAGGVLIESASSTVGGLTATPGTAPGNLISGNKAYGVEIDGSSATGALVEGNLIGTDVTGTKALGNTDSGVDLEDASGATVGGTVATAGNVISANSGNGVHILDTSTGNVVEGNFIGTNAAGTKALGNADDGVLINANSTGNTVGGSTAGATNVISANTESGVVISGTGTTGNLVAGDFIGTNAAGTAAIGNKDDGVLVESGSNTVGGLTTTIGAAPGNLISGNKSYGVVIDGSAATDDLVVGNLIGTDVSGTQHLGNGAAGVEITGKASAATVGGTTAAARNVISGNSANGMVIGDSSTDNLVEGDFVGTDVTGSVALGNAYNGILINGGSSGNTIGGTAQGAGLVLSGNTQRGLFINGANDNLAEGNFIGTDVTGTKALGDGVIGDCSGVRISSGDGNTIGGTSIAARNIISGCGYDGIHITNGSSGNLVEGDYVGTDVTGTNALGNSRFGVEVDTSATNNTIGGTATGAGLLIVNNVIGGVGVEGAGTGNQFEDDTIDSNGNASHASDGVYIHDTKSTTVSGCTIDDNKGWGIVISGSASTTDVNNTITGNGKGSVSG